MSPFWTGLILTNPTVQTDKSDYFPGSVVTITGTGWTPGETVTLTFQEVPYYDAHPPIATIARNDGTILDQTFTPDVHDGGITFILTATGSTSGGTATTTFLDSAYNLDHCANIDLSHLTDACGNTAPGAHPTWVNGDLNRNNSAYREGDGVPHRLAVPALTDGQWFIELDYDFTKGGKYAFDRLTSLQLTQAANPCADTTCGTGPVNFAIPSGSSESTHPSVNLDALHVGGRVAPLKPTTEALMSAWVQGGSFLFPRASVPSPRSVPVAVTVRGNC